MRGQAMLSVALVLAGCAGSTGEVSGDGAVGEDVAATVEVKVQEDSVRLLLHVTNTGDRGIEFRFPTSQRHDFVVRDEGGVEVWRWSEGMMFLQAISRATLAPGETWDFEGAWAPGNRTGRFQVVGRVTAAERDVEQSAAFELP
jgi:Intracellular proteinase inhibitor